VRHFAVAPLTVKTKSAFWEMIPVLGVKPKRCWCLFLLFFKIGICSDISFKRSRRELSNEVEMNSNLCFQ